MLSPTLQALFIGLVAVGHLPGPCTVEGAAIAKKPFEQDNGNIVTNNPAEGSTCAPSYPGEVLIRHSNGTFLQSVISQMVDDEKSYPGNTTTGVGIVFAQAINGNASSDDASTKWALTPLTASINFKSAFAISQTPNLAASSGKANSSAEALPYCLTQPGTSSSKQATSSSKAYENGTYVLPPLELQPCPDLVTRLSVNSSQLFYLDCQTCEDTGSCGCRIESYLYANECVTTQVSPEEEMDPQKLLGLNACNSSSVDENLQMFSVLPAPRDE